MRKEMPAQELRRLYEVLERDGVRVWIDGGWGVDALIGRQTRTHDDVDFVVEEKDLARVVAFLRDRGYLDVPRDDTRAWNFVLGNDAGNEVDIHVITIAENGDGIYGPPENGEFYPAHALTGTGAIDGHGVLCMSVDYQIVNHTGYDLREKDLADIKVLCETFDRDPPAEYRGRV